MKPHRERSDATLLRIVEGMFLREILAFEGESLIGLRLEGRPPDRSVFAFARLDGCACLAVARVSEADLDEDPDRALRLVYMFDEDVALVLAAILPQRVAPNPN